MQKTLIKNNIVVNVIELNDDTEIVTQTQLDKKISKKQDVSKCWVIPDECVIGPAGGENGDGWDGEDYIKPEPDEPVPPTIEDYQKAIRSIINNTAKSRQYDNAVSCASYVNSTNHIWAAEAQAFVSWRDQVWEYVFFELEKVRLGQRNQPSIEDFIKELPAIEWPE